jgi:DNA-binding response OmpR family regulator
MHAVIVNDDNDLNDYLSFALRRVGLEVSLRNSLDKVIAQWSQRPADFILIRANMLDDPKKLGDIKRLSNVYIILLFDKADEDSEAEFLQAGADIILHLPIGLKLLTAYVQSLMRRSQSAAVNLLPIIDLGNLVLNPASRTVKVMDFEPCSLTQLEFRLLYLLMTHPGQVISADVIVDRVWGYGESGSKELVRGLISRVRAKVEPNPSKPLFIHTLPGVGYLFEPT